MKFTAHPLGPPIDLPRVGVDKDLISRLRLSFATLRPMGEQFTVNFYGKLFAAYPHIRRMFPADMDAQQKKLFSTLQWIVEHLEEGKELRLAVRELGKRHEGYGALPEHYPIVTDFLLAAMAETTGAGWGPSIESDWRTALELINSIMLGRT